MTLSPTRAGVKDGASLLPLPDVVALVQAAVTNTVSAIDSTDSQILAVPGPQPRGIRLPEPVRS